MSYFLLHVKHSFAATRALRDFIGKCAEVANYHFTLQANVKTPVTERGYAVDFYQIQNYLQQISAKLDQQFLNELDPFITENPSTENIAKYFYQQLQNYLNIKTIQLLSVTVWETAEFGATYAEHDPEIVA